MVDSLRLEGSGRSVDLYSWLANRVKGHEALAGIVGFGLPPVENFWFEGAGAGSSWRGARVGRRTIELPLRVYAANRAELNELLSDLAVILDPNNKPVSNRGVARMYFGLPDGDEWWLDVSRVGGGDWARKVDSDDRTYFKTTLQLEVGDPFWTRTTPESFEIRTPSDSPTLLPKMARLRVSPAAAFGEHDVQNAGDTTAWAVFTVIGPTTRVLLQGPNGEKVEWIGTLAAGEGLIIDMEHNIVEDLEGVNRYDGLAPAPRFWSIAPGSSRVFIQADDVLAESFVLAQWWPRRWAAV